MCGICGIADSNNVCAGELQSVANMNHQLFHRGPNEQGVYKNKYIVMGIRRLSIIDLDNGSQPISNEDGNIHVVFNGEIYNHAVLRTELKKRGHQFKTASDTECIVHAYEEYDVKMLSRLNGMFAFSLWDDRKKTLFIARDRFGQKPLYYSIRNKRITYGSELKAVLLDPHVKESINLKALYHYLSLQYIPEPFTAYNDIFKLPSAHYLIWQNGKVTIEKYWQLGFEPKLKISFSEACVELRNRMNRAVARRLISDVPLGAFLSGGIDSALVVALMAQNSDQRIKTFSIGFPEDSFNELSAAKRIAEQWDTEHREFCVTPDDMNELLPKIVQSFDEPFADSCAYQTYYLSKFTRQYVTVALNGDGGDEIFAGYPRYWMGTLTRAYRLLPRVLSKKILPFIFSCLREPENIPIEKNWIMGLRRLAQTLEISTKANILQWGSYFTEAQKKELLRPQENEYSEGTEEFLSKFFDNANAQSTLEKTMYTDIMSYLPGNGLVKSDRMTMAHSLEARSPFLDHEVAEFAARLPSKYKLNGLTTKHIVREAFKGDIPEEIRKLPKRGFAAPIELWLRKDLRPFVFDTLASSNAGIHSFCNTNYITRILKEHYSGTDNHGRRIWCLLVLEIWLNQINHKEKNRD